MREKVLKCDLRMLVVALDVGIRNLGMCVYDYDKQVITFWQNVPLIKNNSFFRPGHTVRYVKEFVERYKTMFENAAIVLVEQQMRLNMRIIEAILQTLFYEKCVVLSPRIVKMHYDLCKLNYRENKKAAIEWAHQYVAEYPHMLADSVSFSGKKLDDLADSLLMIDYFLSTYDT